MRDAILRTKSGCLTCRNRHKKCNEGKPVCEACARLRLTCTWESCHDGITRPYSDKNQLEHLSSVTELVVHAPLRIADHDAAQAVAPFSFSEASYVFESGQKFPTSVTDFAKSFDEHIIISGVFHGWDTVRKQFDLDFQWDALIDLDAGTQACGHGPVARMASIWCWRKTMRVRTNLPPISHTNN